MLNKPYDYNIFYDFIESYLPSGFTDINADDPIMLKLEDLLAKNDQFFSMADLGKMQFVYNSKRSQEMMGFAPEVFHPGHFADAVHPVDMERFGLARSLVFRIERDIFKALKGSKVLSANFLMKNPSGCYTNLLFQCYIFYTPLPTPKVYDLQLYTNVDSFHFKANGFHHYLGNDLSQFRFPDNELLKMGPSISAREFEIIRLIEEGLSTKQIAEKLFLSVYTVNTHRSNILEKSGKTSIPDLIYLFKEQGLL
jgi:DNA-binding CsgD family transcriptional regulator